MEKRTMKGDYYNSKETVQEYIRLSEGISGSELIDKLKQYLSPEAKVLEIGSGPGTDYMILKEMYKVTGSDNSKEFLDHLKNENPNGKFLNLDAVTLKTTQNFDGIYSNKVLHHLSDNELKDALHRQYEILNTDGIICHSFWKGEGSEVFKGLFVNYHSKETLRTYYENHFEMLLLEEYAEFEESDSLLLIARKK